MSFFAYSFLIGPILLLSTILLYTKTLPIMVFSAIALLVLTFVAMLFLMTQYLALIFLIVYVGAIAILLVFGLMVFDTQNAAVPAAKRGYLSTVGILAAAVSVLATTGMADRISYQRPKSSMSSPLYNFSEFDEFIAIGKHLYTTYAVEFLTVGSLLVLGMVVVIALTVPPRPLKTSKV